jgi:hypothetical protein
MPSIVGVVIVTFGGIQRTRVCLDSLRTTTFRDFDVVVVDNASADGTVETIARDYPEVVLLCQAENLGYAGGNNAGIRYCLERGYRSVLILNNDTVVAPDLLKRMCTQLESADVVVPQVFSLEEPPRVVTRAGSFDWKRGRFVNLRDLGGTAVAETPRLVNLAGGCCLLISRAVFEEIGLLDERFFLYYEDFDFLARARAAGFRLLFEPRAVVYHAESSSSGGEGTNPLRLYYNCRNRLLFMKKNGALKLPFLGWFLTTRVLYTAAYVLSGRASLALATWRGVWDFFSGRLGPARYAS